MAALPALTALSGVASLAGTGMGVAGALQQGGAAQAAANYSAQMDRQQGQTDFAAAQRAANEKRLQTDLVQSKQIADAAGSGAGVQTPSILDIYGQTAARGKYLAEGAQYQGAQRQQAYNNMATDALYRGGVAQQAGDLSAIGTGLSGLSKVKWGDFNFG